MENKLKFISTPIYYVNANPHLGHAYTTIVGDFLRKLAISQGKQVFYMSGTDEHGEKIAEKARAAGKEPLEFADSVSKNFELAWEKLDIDLDCFYRTTSEKHYKMVQSALQLLKDKGDIYFAEYEGKYCVGCERFRTDSEWTEDDLCPDHQTKADLRKEPNYFFKMSSYQKQLIEYYEKNSQAVRPAQYMQEVLSFLKQPLEDLNISRPVERLSWGIPLPFDDKYVTYVWFDALLNYLGGLGYEGKAFGENENFRKDMWAESHHLVGKDILKTHAIYWPTMLMGLGLPPFKSLEVGGFWMSKGLKMSKTLGNVVEPIKVTEVFGNDPFRFFLLREMSYGSDSSFTWESFINRCNSELANGLGNLASRVLNLAHKHFESTVPPLGSLEESDEKLLESLRKLPETVAQEFADCRYHMGLGLLSEGVAECDRYINDHKPWTLAKDPAQKKRLATVLRVAMEGLKIFSVLFYPVTPKAALELQAALGLALAKEGAWAKATEPLNDGEALGEIPRLFPRLELPKEE